MKTNKLIELTERALAWGNDAHRAVVDVRIPHPKEYGWRKDKNLMKVLKHFTDKGIHISLEVKATNYGEGGPNVYPVLRLTLIGG